MLRRVYRYRCYDTSEDIVVNYKTGCWIWQRAKIKSGYAAVWHNNKWYLGHRVTYLLRFGRTAKGLVLDHLCRQRSCVNPYHLEAVTPTENVRRGLSTKLTEEKAKEIRELQGKYTGRQLALMYHVSPSTISSIQKGKKWTTP